MGKGKAAALLDLMNFLPGACELFKLLPGILFSVSSCLWSYYPANAGRVRVRCVQNLTALILDGNQNKQESGFFHSFIMNRN